MLDDEPNSSLKPHRLWKATLPLTRKLPYSSTTADGNILAPNAKHQLHPIVKGVDLGARQSLHAPKSKLHCLAPRGARSSIAHSNPLPNRKHHDPSFVSSRLCDLYSSTFNGWRLGTSMLSSDNQSRSRRVRHRCDSIWQMSA